MSDFVKRLNYNPIGGANNASGVTYDNSGSGLTATNVQDAIDELDSDISAETARAIAAENTLQSNIDAEETRALAAEAALDDKIDQEILDRQAADALLIPLSQKGQPNGVATLDGSGLVPASQLPSYVDDVLEYPTLGDFPVTGETGKIYVALDTNFQYRWSGSTYIQLSVSPVSSVFGRTGAVVSQSGDYTASQVTNVPSGNLAATDVQNALNELQTDIDTRATQTALDDHINDLTDAHDASAISSVPSGGLSSTDVQSALNELDSEKLNNSDFDSTFDTRLATKSTTDLAEGSNLYFTDERSQDSVGTILVDSASVDLTYDDVTPSISATVIPSGVNHNQLANYVANEHIDHSSVEIVTAPDSGLSGGGDITATRNLSVDINGTTALGATPDGLDELLVYDSSTSNLRKVTYSQILSGVVIGSPGDINEGTLSVTNNQSIATDVIGLSFNNAVVRSFQAIVSVVIDADSDLFEKFEINGIQRGADWIITVESTGDDSGVEFDITASGQIQYTSLDYTGFSSGNLHFRAITTSV